IVISIEDKLNYLEQPIPPALVVPAGQHVAPEILAAHNAWIKGSKKIAGLMLLTMEPEIQQNLETLHVHEMLLELKTMFAQQVEQELLQTTRDFHSCKQKEVQLVSLYVLKMKGYIDNLERLGYPVTLGLVKKHIGKLQHDGLLDSGDLRDFEKCVSCMSGKMARKPYTHQVERAKDLLGLIHTNVCGPFKIMSRQGASYFVTFTDDFNRYGYVYLLKHKYKVFETFKVFQKEVENQLGKTIKSLRSDRGGEYMSQEFLDHLKDHGIIAHRTPPYTLQHNGVSERRNRTLLDMVRSMMSQKTLPKSFWDYALETAARILNMFPTKKGCEVLVKRDTLTKPNKLEPRSIKCIFIGYPKETMGYSFYYPPENKVLIAQNAKFLKNSLITQEASGSLEDLEIIQEEDTHPSIDTSLNHEEDDLEIDEPQSDIIPIRRSTRKRHAPDRMCLYIDAEEHGLGDLGEPANYKAALLDPEAIRILIAIAAYYDYKIWQMNVKTAFLNGYLNEEVYMEQPEGFVNLKYPNRRYCMENSKRGSILMQEKLKLSKSEGASTHAELKRMQNVPYAFAVGSIMYAVRCTRPDVVFTQNVTSRFQQNPGDLHWTTTGYVFVLNGGVIDWKSAKQSIFATSSAEVEYIVAFDASKEAVWVRKLISGLGVVPTIEESISARHFRAKVHYLREVIEYGDVKLEKVHTYDNLSDPFTKALAFPKHSEHTRNIGMLPASSLM
nr:hypothetical protein [Tanacetum cinerariifolium]